MKDRTLTLIAPFNLSNFNMPLSPPYSLALLKGYIESISEYKLHTSDTRLPFFYKLIQDDRLRSEVCQGSLGLIFREWREPYENPKGSKHKDRLKR